ncbi:MAG: aminomethyl-transferring glycine dehydrogenase subunit GcvPA [Euryarchaeota archaeon]|nr:aminomethyl-transferring glycine dehydrogenase subunit GcvPA [Euryarchaeota archaeon]
MPSAKVEEQLLKEIGLKDVEELFTDVPRSVRADLDLAPSMSEMEVKATVEGILGKNRHFGSCPSFLGAGIYPHYVPSEVKFVLWRNEFLTSYTPYQPEVSQGFLQAMFEYQSMICELYSMDVANISMYDGVSACGEAALMAARSSDGDTYLVPKNLSWEKKSTIENYLKGTGIRVEEYAYDGKTGQADLADLERKMTSKVTGVFMENPNFFGCFESKADTVKPIVSAKNPDALFVVGANPMSLGIAKGPGAYGADVVVGEGQVFGQGMNFGGPVLGILAATGELARRMPGRIVGETKDATGQRAFCLTLQTREQHIRREKATSNICTNEGMNALAAASYLAVVGGNGLRKVSEINASRAKRLSKAIGAIPGFKAPLFKGHHFNEFVVQSKASVAKVQRLLLERGLHGGLDLSKRFPELGNASLWAVTEMHAEATLETLVSTLKEVRA